MTQLKKLIEGEDVLTGAHWFDQEMLIKAHHDIDVLALLDKDTRKKIHNIASYNDEFVLTEKDLTFYAPQRNFKNESDFVEQIDEILALVSNLTSQGDQRTRIIQILKTETLKDVLLNYLNLITTHFKRNEEIDKIVSHLMNFNPESLVRITAAQHFGEEGKKFLLEILPDQSTYRSQRIEIIEYFTACNYKESLSILMKMYEANLDYPVALSLLKAFQKFKDKRVSPLLVSSLNAAPSDLICPIIDTLAVCGTIDAVESLYQVKQKQLNPMIKNTAQKAITQIQPGLDHVDSGRLTLSEIENEEGHLSLDHHFSHQGHLSIENDTE